MVMKFDHTWSCNIRGGNTSVFRKEGNILSQTGSAAVGAGRTVLETAGSKRRSCSRVAKKIISHDLFDQTVVTLILVNCVILAFDDPASQEAPRWQRISDTIFTAAFALEMSLKLAATGIHYFMDAWNWLDAVVVCEGIFVVFSDTSGSNMESLRILRVLRPLRTVRRMPRVQFVVTSLFRAGWTLGRIVCIFLVWLTIFAIMGVLLWSGTFDMRCLVATSSLSPPERGGPSVHSIYRSLKVNSLSRRNRSGPKLLSTAQNRRTEALQAPFEESSNMSDSSSGEEVPGPYPPSSSEMSRSDDSSNVASGDENDTIYYMDMGLCGIPENASSSPVCQSLNVLNSPYVCREDAICEDSGSPPRGGMLSFDNLLWSLLTLFTVTTLEGWHEVMMYTQRVMSEYTIWFFVILIVSATWAIMSLMIAAMLARFKAVSLAENLRLMQEKEAAEAVTEVHEATPPAWLSIIFMTMSRTAEGMLGGIVRVGIGLLDAGSSRVAGCINAYIESNPQGRIAGVLRRLRDAWKHMAAMAGLPSVKEAVGSEDSFFAQAIHCAIVVNLVVISMGGYNVGARKTVVLNSIGLGLTVTFAAEALVKIYVLGTKHYFRSSWNRFDFVVAVTSVVEVVVTAFFDNGNALAAVRLLKVLRVFRILRMRRLKRTVMTVVGVVVKSARDLWPVVALMLLILFVFTVLGMQLFGATINPLDEDYGEEDYAVKMRFDTFFWSFVQVFMVVAGDDWVSIMYRTMEATSRFSAVFFVALIVLGQFVLLNLVLAVVLEGASDQMKEKHAAQQFRENTLRIFHSQYRRIAIRRWAVKVKAQAMLERGHALILPEGEAEYLGLLGFPRSRPSMDVQSSSTSSSSCSDIDPQTFSAPGSFTTIRSFPACTPSYSPPWFSPRARGTPQRSFPEAPFLSSSFLDGCDKDLVSELGITNNIAANKGSTGTDLVPDEGIEPLERPHWFGGTSTTTGEPCTNQIDRIEQAGRIGHLTDPRSVTAGREGQAKVGEMTGDRVGDERRGMEEKKADGVCRSVKNDRSQAFACHPTDGLWKRGQLGNMLQTSSHGGSDNCGSPSEKEVGCRRDAVKLSPHGLLLGGDNSGNGGGDENRRAGCDRETIARSGNRDDGSEAQSCDARGEALEKLPRALYGVFSDMMMQPEQWRWWMRLDRVFGTRVDQLTWDKWYLGRSPIRMWCKTVVTARHFETVMLGFVLGSTILSMYHSESLSSPVWILDTLCLSAFVAELWLRVSCYGWWVGPDAVLRNPWALLDVYLVASHGVTTMATVLGIWSLNNIKRVLKSARPLRIIRRVRPLHEMSAALVHSLRSCGTLLVLIATVWFGYSMVGVELFGGKFYFCTDPDFASKSSRYGEFDSETGVWSSPPCNGEWVDPDTGKTETRDYEWTNAVDYRHLASLKIFPHLRIGISRFRYNFDTIGPALLSVLIVSTLDGWVSIFFDATDAYAIDHQPSENTNLQSFWYFFLGIIVFGFYITNLFVGVMFEAFLSYKNMDSNGRLVSQEERRWRDYENRLCQVSPVVAPCSCSDQPWRVHVQRFVTSEQFSNFVIGVLVVNAIVLAVDGTDIPEWQSTAQDWFSDAFALIFVAEATLALIGLGPRCYFSTSRQTFDFVVTVASLLDVLLNMSDACSEHDIVLLRLVRSLRVFRVIRLATHIPGFDKILAACTYPARILASVFVLLALGLYIFANIGVALFSSADLENQ